MGLTVADNIEEVKKIKKYAPAMSILYSISIDDDEDDDEVES